MHDDAIVRLSNLGKQDYWTGVVISETGEILTTSQTLGNAPIVDIELSDGTRGQACVTGRDDRIGLALLKPLVEPRAYDFAELSGTAPVVGEQIGLLQHTRFSSALDQRITIVSGYRSSSTGDGYDYFQILAADNSTGDGAVLINERGQLQGMRMPSAWLLQNEVGNPGEVWAVDAPSIASIALPFLRSKPMFVGLPPVTEGPGPCPPCIPPLISGAITLDGKDVPAGSTLHARIVGEGQPDLWAWTTIETPGEFILVLPCTPCKGEYLGATIEFWLECRRCSTTATLERWSVPFKQLDLAF